MRQVPIEVRKKVFYKFAIFIEEFRKVAKVDENTNRWDAETQEKFEYLNQKWIEFCDNNCFDSPQQLNMFKIEVKVILGCALRLGKEKDLRNQYLKEAIKLRK